LLSHPLSRIQRSAAAQVIARLQAVEPLALIGPEQVRLSLLRQGDIVARVSSLDVRKIILRRTKSVAGNWRSVSRRIADHPSVPLREHQ
jgi:hypothetical protein